VSGIDIDRSVLLVGGHDAGKSNYVGRLWLGLRRGDGLLAVPEDPEQIEYVETLIAEIRQGRYAGRTDLDGEARNFEGTSLVQGGSLKGLKTRILVPDVAGELWERTSSDRELDADWIDRIERCSGALLFLRFGSKHHVPALDWVTSAELMRTPLARAVQKSQIASQIFLTDMLNLLDLHLGKRLRDVKPRVSVVVAAWDAIPPDEQAAGPFAYIQRTYPMFAGRLADRGRLDAKAFGTSITGGDLVNEAHRAEFLASDAEEEGYVVYEGRDGQMVERRDLTIPVAWALGVELPEAA